MIWYLASTSTFLYKHYTNNKSTRNKCIFAYIHVRCTQEYDTQRFQCAQKVINLITKDWFMLSLVRTFPGITLIRLDWIVVSDRRLHSIKQLMTSNEEVFIVLPLISIKLSSFECIFFFSYSCVYGVFPLLSFYSANIMCLLWICFRFDLTIVQHTDSSSPFTQKTSLRQRTSFNYVWCTQ